MPILSLTAAVRRHAPRALTTLALVSCATLAQADVVTFDLHGVVDTSNGSLSGVVPGTLVTGRFSYDTDVPAQPSPLTWWNEYDTGPGSYFRMQVGDHQIASSSMVIVTYGAEVGTFVDFGHESTLQIDHVSQTTAYSAVRLAMGPDWPDTTLPRSYAGARYNSELTFAGIFTGGPNNTTMFTYVITSISPVPEPTSAALLVAGLGWLAWRRQRRT